MFFLKIVCFLIVICGILADDEKKWLKFKKDYNKVYKSPADEKVHKQAFFSNLKLIEKHNKDFKDKKTTYEMGINEFADILPEDSNGNTIVELNDNLKYITQSTRSRSPVPDYMNWVKRGYTNPALKQGQCGACYAFATVAGIEAQYFIKKNKLIKLSEQDAVNCGHLFGSLGCKGGRIKGVLKMVKKRGILFEKDEPYKDQENICKAQVLNTVENNDPYVKIEEYYRIQRNNEEALKEAVANIGPIIVDIHYVKSLRFYRQGVYYEPNCNEDFINHSVLIVGYGTTEKGEDYWIVRNSWGENWGENGHVLMSRNRRNNCNIAGKPYYPVILNNNSNEMLEKRNKNKKN